MTVSGTVVTVGMVDGCGMVGSRLDVVVEEGVAMVTLMVVVVDDAMVVKVGPGMLAVVVVGWTGRAESKSSVDTPTATNMVRRVATTTMVALMCRSPDHPNVSAHLSTP